MAPAQVDLADATGKCSLRECPGGDGLCVRPCNKEGCSSGLGSHHICQINFAPTEDLQETTRALCQPCLDQLGGAS